MLSLNNIVMKIVFLKLETLRDTYKPKVEISIFISQPILFLSWIVCLTENHVRNNNTVNLFLEKGIKIIVLTFFDDYLYVP